MAFIAGFLCPFQSFNKSCNIKKDFYYIGSDIFLKLVKLYRVGEPKNNYNYCIEIIFTCWQDQYKFSVSPVGTLATAAARTYSVEKNLSKSCTRYILHRIPQRLDKVVRYIECKLFNYRQINTKYWTMMWGCFAIW